MSDFALEAGFFQETRIQDPKESGAAVLSELVLSEEEGSDEL